MWTFVLNVLLVASAGGVPASFTTTQGRLPAPAPTQLHAFSDKIIIEWPPVTSGPEPVVGYKVRLWMGKGVKTFTYKTVNGTSGFVEELKMPKLIDFKAEDGKLYEYLLTGADHSQLTIRGIKLATPYLYEVLAYGAGGDGESSGPSGFQLDGPGQGAEEETGEV